MPVLYAYNLIVVSVQMVEVLVCGQESIGNKLIQDRFRDTGDVHSLLPNEVDKLAECLIAAVRIITVERCHLPTFAAGAGIDSRRLSAAGTPFRNQTGSIAATVKVFLNVRNYHVALGNKDATAWMQF